MAQPIQEPTEGRTDQALAFRSRQLFRRPSSAGATQPWVWPIKVIADARTVTTGDGKMVVAIPFELDGTVLTRAEAWISTVSSSGLPTVQINNVTDSVDMLSTKITIDVSEETSYTAATPSVVNTSNDDVTTGDIIRVDVDVAGTGAKGLGVILTFQ